MSQDPEYQFILRNGLRPWNELCSDMKLKGYNETRTIECIAEQLCKAVQCYYKLLSERSCSLREHISELFSIANNLDKVSKGTKIAGITGGATGVAGGVAAAGGVTGASAAIAHKVNTTQDKKKLDKIFQDYDNLMKDIMFCLKYINTGFELLKEKGSSTLNQARRDLGNLSKVIDLAATGGASAKAIEANSKASGLIEGFALGMDFYFTQGKDGQSVKRGLESKFAKKIRKLADQLRKGFQELLQIKTLFKKCCPEE
uniref:Apolipoprotein L, 1 n=1 Tax=Anabas testudineus TaxID=64144 RepID=A0A7N6FKQ3_ANATE